MRIRYSTDISRKHNIAILCYADDCKVTFKCVSRAMADGYVRDKKKKNKTCKIYARDFIYHCDNHLCRSRCCWTSVHGLGVKRMSSVARKTIMYHSSVGLHVLRVHDAAGTHAHACVMSCTVYYSIGLSSTSSLQQRHEAVLNMPTRIKYTYVEKKKKRLFMCTHMYNYTNREERRTPGNGFALYHHRNTGGGVCKRTTPPPPPPSSLPLPFDLQQRS